MDDFISIEYDNSKGYSTSNGCSLITGKIDMNYSLEGEDINPESIISLRTEGDKIVFPKYETKPEDVFIKKVNRSGEKWIIFTNENNEPKLVLDADGFIRSELFCKQCEGIESYCHIPLIIQDQNSNLGDIIQGLRSKLDNDSDKPIEKDLALIWGENSKRIITGADIFGRLLKGI